MSRSSRHSRRDVPELGSKWQERLTEQIADRLADQLHPGGMGVVIQAEHSCMALRGIQATGSSTVTSTMLGTLRANGRSPQEFFALSGLP